MIFRILRAALNVDIHACSVQWDEVFTSSSAAVMFGWLLTDVYIAHQLTHHLHCCLSGSPHWWRHFYLLSQLLSNCWEELCLLLCLLCLCFLLWSSLLCCLLLQCWLWWWHHHHCHCQSCSCRSSCHCGWWGSGSSAWHKSSEIRDSAALLLYTDNSQESHCAEHVTLIRDACSLWQSSMLSLLLQAIDLCSFRRCSVHLLYCNELLQQTQVQLDHNRSVDETFRFTFCTVSFILLCCVSLNICFCSLLIVFCRSFTVTLTVVTPLLLITDSQTTTQSEFSEM